MSQALAVRESDRLEELANQIRAGHEEVGRGLERSLRYAIKTGLLLLEAKVMLKGRARGEFASWVEAECGLGSGAMFFYMRVAHYQNILPNGLNLREAGDYLRGLPPVDGRRMRKEYPEEVKEEARRLKGEGRGYAEIARTLGVTAASVKYWCGGCSEQGHVRRARLRKLARQAKREEARQQAVREARKKGGSIAKSVEYMRKFTQALDSAGVDEDDPEIRRLLRDALSRAYEAERLILLALGVDYGGTARESSPLRREQARLDTLKPPLTP